MTNEHRGEEEALRRALHDAAAHVPPVQTSAQRVERRETPAQRWRRPLIGALVALLAVAAIPISAALVGDGGGHGGRTKEKVDRVDGTERVLAALAATVGAGSYDLEFTFHITPSHDTPWGAPSPCGGAVGSSDQASCVASSPALDVSGHGTVNTNPYAMTVVTGNGSLGGITLFVDDTDVWEFGGFAYGTGGASRTPDPAGPGEPLAGFATLVEGSLGQGEGALSMISLASHTGYLGLESEMVTGAASDGQGTLDDGTHVTYFRVDIDITRMANGATLSDQQRQAIADAVVVLRSAGYSGTDERIGVDDAGFIRDVVATTNFTDGSSMTRHSSFSNFGCAKRVTMPDEPAVDAPGGTCPPVPATTSTVVPTPTSTTAGTTTTTVGTPSTTAAPTTAPAPTSTPPTSTSLVEPSITG